MEGEVEQAFDDIFLKYSEKNMNSGSLSFSLD